MNKKVFILGIFIALILLFAGCSLDFSLSGLFNFSRNTSAEEEVEEYQGPALPAEMVLDVPRSASRSFAFETLLPVRLVLAVSLYSDSAEPAETGAEGIIVLLENSAGKIIFGGKTDPRGKLNAEIKLPAAREDMTLLLHLEGFESRRIPLPGMVNYEEINRSVNMIKKTSAVFMSRSISGMQDSDGDGIPDVYDAYPNDPNSAFAYLMPAEGNLTIAFEDLFGKADAGDADYNDFIAHYNIEESSNESGVTRISVGATAAVKLAGYNHSFGIRINSFLPPADLTVNYIDSYGRPATRTERITASPNPGETFLEVVLFENSAYAVGKDAGFTLEFVNADLNNPQDPEVLSRPPYNPFVVVKNTGHDIHLIDEEPNYNSKNPGDTFRDEKGFPWALLVPPGPEGWIHPAEGERIEVRYPRFTRWRESWGELSPDWYLHRDNPWTEPVLRTLVFSSNRDGYYQIYSYDLASETLVKLTANTATDKFPALSPDGTKIAFVSDRSGSWGIYTMNIDGTDVSGLIASLAGANHGRPSWSPEGTRIAFDNNRDIFTMNSDGTGVVNITGTVFTNEIEPAWSPDGVLIAFSSNADGDYDIYVMNSDGSGAQVKLTDNTVIDQKPAWSPDGSRIAFSSNLNSNYDIFSMNRDGSGLVNITNTAGENETAPAWSVNGIAFVKNEDVYILDPEEPGAWVNITNHAASDLQPSW